MTIAGEIATQVSWRGILVSGMIGMATAGAYICYIEAFRNVGAPAATISYVTKLALSPYFIVAVLLSGSSIVARPFLYEALGAQKGYFVMVGIGAVVSTAIIIAFFRERMDNLQYIGALMAICGSILVARG